MLDVSFSVARLPARALQRLECQEKLDTRAMVVMFRLLEHRRGFRMMRVRMEIPNIFINQ